MRQMSKACALVPGAMSARLSCGAFTGTVGGICNDGGTAELEKDGGPGRDRTDDLPGKPGRAQAFVCRPSINSTMERCDFQLLSCRSRLRASERVSNRSS